MLTVEEKGHSYTSRRRRYIIIAGIVFGLLVVVAIGIVVGYFIGRSSSKSSDIKPAKDGKYSQQQLEEIRKEAVAKVSTKNLKENLR